MNKLKTHFAKNGIQNKICRKAGNSIAINSGLISNEKLGCIRLKITARYFSPQEKINTRCYNINNINNKSKKEK